MVRMVGKRGTRGHKVWVRGMKWAEWSGKEGVMISSTVKDSQLTLPQEHNDHRATFSGPSAVISHSLSLIAGQSSTLTPHMSHSVEIADDLSLIAHPPHLCSQRHPDDCNLQLTFKMHQKSVHLLAIEFLVP